MLASVRPLARRAKSPVIAAAVSRALASPEPWRLMKSPVTLEMSRNIQARNRAQPCGKPTISPSP